MCPCAGEQTDNVPLRAEAPNPPEAPCKLPDSSSWTGAPTLYILLTFYTAIVA